MQLSGSTLTDSVILQIKGFSGFTGQKVYNERQVQNLVRPCFFVQQINLSQQRELGVRYRRDYRISITWLPKQDDPTPRKSCREVGELLLGVFRYLHLPENQLEHVKEPEYEIVDNELRFRMDVTIFAEWVDDVQPTMQTFDTNVNYKES